jgi:hypothetical protein
VIVRSATTAPFDIPAPYAGPAIAIIAVAFAFLMLIDWTHPNAPTNRPET